MTTPSTVDVAEQNKVIAEFMGGVYCEYPDKIFTNEFGYRFPKNILHSGWWNVRALRFHESWDWIMLVVEKIEAMPDQWGYAVRISKMSTAIFRLVPLKSVTICEAGGIVSKIEATHKAVYEFIIWYNKTLTP